MRQRLLLWCGLLVLLQQGTFAAPAIKNDPIKMEMARLEGAWRVLAYSKSGVAKSDEDLKDYPRFIVKDGEYQWENTAAKGKIVRIDPTAKPKEIDFEFTDENNQAVREFGIYEIDGDTYRDCIAPNGQARPKEFTTTARNGYTMMTSKRDQRK